METPNNSDLVIEIKSISRKENDSAIYVSISIRGGSNSERRLFCLPESYVFEKELKKGFICRELFSEMESRANEFSAYRRGANILGYGANSRKGLERKLIQRGFDKSTAKGAVEELSARGYINEEEDALHEAEKCLSKLWGEKRIRSALAEKGYYPKSELLSSLFEHTDFIANCEKLIQKKYRTLPSEKSEIDKMIAFLVRYGYSFSQIKEAIRTIEENEY